MENNLSLSDSEIKRLVQEKVESYKNFSNLEQYAIFMGKAQILEFGLKGLLSIKYEFSFESIEKWTLGRVKNELEKKGLRQDFITLLSSVVTHRNHIAHEFLVNNSIVKSLGDFSDKKLYGDLFCAIYELEQIIIIYDWNEENNGWG
ncbi:hypothetical protein ACM66Z_05715 [Sulfurovum sp. ST-21]|uniref:hypothetical protein n=1 Tax=Sulfurovum TaxID=265570 RepID=UPI0018D4D4A4|nr:hypothetical protein [Sulfurovum indicum]